MPSSTEVSTSVTPAPRFGDGRDWWFHRRFGLFLHWGLYAINGLHEQEQWRYRVRREQYVTLAEKWNPIKFNPDAWLDLAESAGMKYICLTTKHHDGFCLWDTKLTPYNTMNTPYGRDIVKQLADACHRRKFPLCLYYSVVDWHQRNYPNQSRHHELPAQPGDEPDLAKYIEFLRGQVRELCSNYGQIHGIWWDMNVDKHVDPSINQMIRTLQPTAVINDRGYDAGDFGTPERDYSSDGNELPIFSKRTEACQSVGAESWGYRNQETYYADRHLLRSIAKYLARDANYLLNIGPMADGTFPEESSQILKRIGQWYEQVREALEHTEPANHLTQNREVLLTRRGNTVYIIAHKELSADSIKLKPLRSSPRSATLLNTGAKLAWTFDMQPSDHRLQKGFLRLINLPVNELANTVMVIKLEFDHSPEVATDAPAMAANDIHIQ